MIKIENVDVYGWEATIRGMRNPMNSWEKSDSEFLIYGFHQNYVIGDNDLKLMRNLAKAGPDHGKFLRMINVTCDITAPLYWWKEFDTYKVGTIVNSCSTMHKIAEKKFTLEDFSCEHLIEDDEVMGAWKSSLNRTIADLNTARELFLENNDKKYWWQMIQLLPASFNQKRTVQLNYQVLRNIYHARKEHKLDEWRYFCEWLETLPYSELITD